MGSVKKLIYRTIIISTKKQQGTKDHLKKLEVVLAKLLQAGLRVNAETSPFYG